MVGNFPISKDGALWHDQSNKDVVQTVEQFDENFEKETANNMNTDILSGKWKQIRGKAQAQWGKLTNDDLDWINGRYEQFVGKVQEKYGRSRAEAKEEVDQFLQQYSS